MAVCLDNGGVALVADDLGAWLIGLLADAGRRKLVTFVLGDEQERALHRACQAALTETSPTLTSPRAKLGVDCAELEQRAVGDASLAAAMRAAGSDGEVTQTLAAAQELMEHWLRAPSPYGKSVITAAIDARRLGVRAPVPDAFLEAAATGYLTPG